MRLSAFKQVLDKLNEISFILPDGNKVPSHFHLTEIGQINKRFIDCGGTVRFETIVSFQLWEANDLEHRLSPQKLNNIISLSEQKLGIVDAEIEVEYQGSTIGKYGIEYNGNEFQLTATFTNCLATDQCGIPTEKLNVNLRTLTSDKKSCCSPGSNCC